MTDLELEYILFLCLLSTLMPTNHSQTEKKTMFFIKFMNVSPVFIYR